MSSLLSRMKKVAEVERKIVENGGEMTPEIEQSLDFSNLSLKKKVDAYAFLVENLREKSRYWDEKAALLKKYSRACEAAAKRIHERIKGNMLLEGVTELLGNDVRYKIQGTAFSLDINERELPEEFFITEIVKTVDREKIRQKILANEFVPGVRRVDNFALKTYANHASKKSVKKISKRGEKNV